MQNIWFVLILNAMAFGINFIVWTMLTVVGIEIKSELNIGNTAFSFLLAIPFLSAALLRIPLDMLAERYSGRVILVLQLSMLSVVCYSMTFAQTYLVFTIFAVFLGVSGATFCLGISYAAKYFEEQKQGLALAVFSSGIIGLVITYTVLPMLVDHYDWKFILQIIAIVCVGFAFVYGVLTLPRKLPRANDIPGTRLRERFSHLKNIQVWRFGLYYFFVFGCFMATALWLPHLYILTFGMELKQAALFSLWFVVPTIIGRKLSLGISEKYSATVVNWSVFWVCMVCLFFLSFPSTSIVIHGVDREIPLHIELNALVFSALVAVMGLAMGIGTSSVYRLISKYYPNNMHGISCLVSSIGTLGGFVLLALFGLLLDLTAIPSSGFILLYIVLGSCMIWMYYAMKRDAFEHRVKQAIDAKFLEEGLDPFK